MYIFIYSLGIDSATPLPPPPPNPQDIVIQAELANQREVERLEKEAEAAQRAEILRSVAEDAKRKHACLLMSKADEESRRANEAWSTGALPGGAHWFCQARRFS